MSIYDRRTTSAYRAFEVPKSYCRNPHILKWWTPAHDELLVEMVEKDQWLWYWGITNRVLVITPPEAIEAWRSEDPLCSKYASYNVIMYFAISRAQSLQITERIRKPKRKTCPICGKRFVEDSLPGPLVQRLGIDHLNFCAPCLKSAVLQGSGDGSLSREGIICYLRELADTLQRVPTQNYGEGVADLLGLDFQERLAILRLLQRKPTVRRVKEVFGSWFEALVEAGILQEGTRQTARGVQCLAKDGHVCLSLGEKTIDDFLHARGIAHAKEPHYPERNFRADFEIGGVFVEYFGLAGDPDYDARIQEKQGLCRKHGIVLISIYARDLVSARSLEKKLIGGLLQGACPCPSSST